MFLEVPVSVHIPRGPFMRAQTEVLLCGRRGQHRIAVRLSRTSRCGTVAAVEFESVHPHPLLFLPLLCFPGYVLEWNQRIGPTQGPYMVAGSSPPPPGMVMGRLRVQGSPPPPPCTPWYGHGSTSGTWSGVIFSLFPRRHTQQQQWKHNPQSYIRRSKPTQHQQWKHQLRA